MEFPAEEVLDEARRILKSEFASTGFSIEAEFERDAPLSEDQVTAIAEYLIELSLNFRPWEADNEHIS